MEDNQINNMNLENLVGGATPPVFSSVQNNQNNMDTTVTNEVNDTNVDSTQAPIEINGEITLPTSLLRDMVAQARKVGVANNMHPVSEAISFTLDENGITMQTSRGSNNIGFIYNNKSFISKKKVSISLDIQIFGEYLNAERNNTVTIKYVEAENTIYIITDTGMRRFPQRMDTSTFTPIVHTFKYPYNYEEMIKVDYDRLVNLIDFSSTARDFANKMSDNLGLQGLYFGDDIIVASDGNIMTIQPNQTELKSEIFFMNNSMCSLIKDIKFNPSKFRIGITKVNGFVEGITASDGDITVCGASVLSKSFPVEPAKNFWKSTSFSESVSFNTKDLSAVVKSIVPFIPSDGDAMDKILFDIDGNIAELRSYDKNNGIELTHEKMGIVNNTNYKSQSSIVLPVSKLEKILQSVDTEVFDMQINPTADNCVCLCYDGIKNILARLTR